MYIAYQHRSLEDQQWRRVRAYLYTTYAAGDRGQQVTVTGEVTYLHSSSVYRTIIVH